jgi:hypothetical protein
MQFYLNLWNMPCITHKKTVKNKWLQSSCNTGVTPSNCPQCYVNSKAKVQSLLKDFPKLSMILIPLYTTAHTAVFSVHQESSWQPPCTLFSHGVSDIPIPVPDLRMYTPYEDDVFKLFHEGELMTKYFLNGNKQKLEE